MAAHARERGFDVTVIGREDYASALGQRFQVAVFAAGNARRYLAAQDPARDLEANVASVYRAIRDFPAERFVLASSVDVYPDPTRIEETREDAPIDLARLSTYGFHKRLAELVTLREAASFVVMRLAQMIGPGLRKGPIYDLLHGEPLRVCSASSYPFLRTARVAELTFELLAGGARGAIFNVCGQGSVALERVLALRPSGHVFAEDARLERYEVDVAAIAARHSVPSSWDEVRKHVREHMESAR